MVSTKKYGILLALVLGLAGFASAMDTDPATVETVTQSLTDLQATIGEHVKEMGKFKGLLKKMDDQVAALISPAASVPGNLTKADKNSASQLKQAKWWRSWNALYLVAGAAALGLAYLGSGQFFGGNSDVDAFDNPQFTKVLANCSLTPDQAKVFWDESQDLRSDKQVLDFTADFAKKYNLVNSSCLPLNPAAVQEWKASYGAESDIKLAEKICEAKGQAQLAVDTAVAQSVALVSATANSIQQSIDNLINLRSQNSNNGVNTKSLNDQINKLKKAKAEKVLAEKTEALKDKFNAIVGVNSTNATRATKIDDLGKVVTRLKELLASEAAKDLNVGYINNKIKKVNSWIKATQAQQKVVDDGLRGIAVSASSTKIELNNALSICLKLQNNTANSQEIEDTVALDAKIDQIKTWLLDPLEQEKKAFGDKQLDRPAMKKFYPDYVMSGSFWSNPVVTAPNGKQYTINQQTIVEMDKVVELVKGSDKNFQPTTKQEEFDKAVGAVVIPAQRPSMSQLKSILDELNRIERIFSTVNPVFSTVNPGSSRNKKEIVNELMRLEQERFDAEVALVTVSSTATDEEIEGIVKKLNDLKDECSRGSYRNEALNKKIIEVRKVIISRNKNGARINQIESLK